MLENFKKYHNLFIFIFIVSFTFSLTVGNELATRILHGVVAISGACLTYIWINGLISRFQPRIYAVNSGAKEDYVTVDLLGNITIHATFNGKTVAIPSQLKARTLISLTAEDESVESGEIEACVFPSDEKPEKIHIYYPYGESNAWLIVISRVDLSNLVK